MTPSEKEIKDYAASFGFTAPYDEEYLSEEEKEELLNQTPDEQEHYEERIYAMLEKEWAMHEND